MTAGERCSPRSTCVPTSHLVIAAEPPGLVVVEHGFRGDAIQVQATDLTFPLETPVTRSDRFGVVRSPVLGSFFWSRTNRPTRASHTVLDESVCVSWPNVELGTDACTRSGRVERRHECWRVGFTQNSS